MLLYSEVGKNNRHCLCETCEKRGRGGFAPQSEETGRSSPNGYSDSDDDSDSDTSSVMSAASTEKEKVNVNERRTRRGVYRIVQDAGDDSEDNEDESDVLEAPQEGEGLDGIKVPWQPDPFILPGHPSAKAAEKPSGSSEQTSSAESTPFKSVITTRAQKAREASMASNASKIRSASLGATENSVSPTPVRHLRPRRSETAEISVATSEKPRGRPRKGEEPTSKDGTATESGPSVRGRSSKATTVNNNNPVTQKATPRPKPAPSVPSCITCQNPLFAEEIEEATSSIGKTSGKGKGKWKAPRIEKDCHR